MASPWLDGRYEPDLHLLGEFVSVPVRAGVATETGRFPKAFDAWVAHELRRSGFVDAEVWPRATRPRVMPSDLALLLERLSPRQAQKSLSEFLAQHPRAARVAPVEARVLGRAYTKQADVLIASWARGVELMVSTKTMVSSYGNNLRNRFEESYGDASNLRGRFPLAALGFLFAVRANIPAADRAFLLDMLNKLKEPTGYDACCLLVVDWKEPSRSVTLRPDLMAEQLSPAKFFSDLVHAVVDRTPVDHHVVARERLAGVPIPVEEGSLTGDDAAPGQPE